MAKTKTPRAPHTLDISAPRFPILDHIFSLPEDHIITWWLIKLNLIGARVTLPTGAHIVHQFTPEDLKAVCPTIYTVLSKNLFYLRTLDRPLEPKALPVLSMLWRHCREPGMFISEAPQHATFLQHIDAITQIEPGKNYVIANIKSYRFFYQTTTTINARVASRKEKTVQSCQSLVDKGVTLTVSELEHRYPGFTKRAHLAVSLGLSAEDIAQHATRLEDDDFELIGKTLPTAALPAL